MSNPVVVVVATAALILASAFFVVIEFSLLGARRQRLETEAGASRSARAALRGVNELTLMLAVAQLGITAATFALGAITKPAVDSALSSLFGTLVPGWLAGGLAFALSLLLVTFLHLVVGEMAPKSWAITHPETAAKLIGLPSRALARFLRPLLTWMNEIANRLVAASGVEPVDRAAVGGQDVETIRRLVEHSANVGALDASFHDQIDDLIDLTTLTVAHLLAERDELTTVAPDATVADVHAAAAASGHMRVVVASAEGRTPRVVHVRDTLLEAADRPVSDLAREALSLTSGTPVYEALSRLRAAGEQLAVVTEQGRTVGVLTVADVLRRVLPQTAPA